MRCIGGQGGSSMAGVVESGFAEAVEGGSGSA